MYAQSVACYLLIVCHLDNNVRYCDRRATEWVDVMFPLPYLLPFLVAHGGTEATGRGDGQISCVRTSAGRNLELSLSLSTPKS